MSLTIFLLTILPWEINSPTVMPVLRLGQGPRATGMGEAFTAIADDATALYWNCAGLGKTDEYSISFTHHSAFAGTTDELLHFALPMNQGRFGLGLLYSVTPEIEFWDKNNQPIDTFSVWDAVLAFGFGIPIVKNYYLGAGVKGCYQDLYTDRGYGAGFDIGFSAQPLSFIQAGIALRNFGALKYTSLEPLPAEIAIGIAYTTPKFKSAIDGVYPFDRRLNFRFGIEYLPFKEISLRIGYRTGPVDLKSLGLFSGITAGVGINLTNLTIDYSLSPYGKLGLLHRLGIRIQLPRRGAGSLRIRIIDAQSQERIRAEIKLDGVRQFTGETNPLGELTLTRLPRGRIVIQTRRDGYLARTDTMLILGDREQSAIIALQPVQYSILTGTIYDRSTTKPLPGIITYKGPIVGEQTTDPDLGTYVIKPIPSGTYILTASAGNLYSPQTCTLTLPPNQLIQKDFYLLRITHENPNGEN